MKIKQFVFRIEQLESKKLLSGFSDVEINSLMRRALHDRIFTRQEVIQVVRSAADGNVVDQRELDDLRRIAALPHIHKQNAYFISSMFNSVANQGRNLKVNSSAADLTWLIDKYFYGKDYPGINSAATYRPVKGPLFRNGPSSEDVDQGGLGDCYLLAAFASVADKDPQIIRNRFIDNNDGTWTVAFFQTDSYNFKTEHFVTVDNMLPVGSSGYAFYAGFGGHWANHDSNELWVGLMEKAYVQWNQTGTAGRGNTRNEYNAISGGLASVVYAQLYPQGYTQPTVIMNVSGAESTLIGELASGRSIVVSRYMNANRSSSHAYHLKSYSQGVYYLVNPWGHSHLSFTFEQLVGSTGRVFRMVLGPTKIPSPLVFNYVHIPARPRASVAATLRSESIRDANNPPINFAALAWIHIHETMKKNA